MTCIASLYSGLLETIDNWAVAVIAATAAEIESTAGRGPRKSS